MLNKIKNYFRKKPLEINAQSLHLYWGPTGKPQKAYIFRFLLDKRFRKRILIFILVISTLISAAKYFHIKPQVSAADSLVKFDEGYSTTTTDTNNNLVGTITNAVWKAEELCKFGKCLFFDGTGDYVSFGNDTDVDFTTGSFTVEGWFRHAVKTSGTDVIVGKVNTADNDGGYQVVMESDGDITCKIDDDDANATFDDAATSTAATYDDNQWHHFACVKNGTTSLTLYIDGTQVAQVAAIVDTGSLTNNDTFYIGIDGDASSNPYTGFLDEIKVYGTTARSTAEVKADFNSETPSRGTSSSFGPNQSIISNGLVGYWNLNESSGNVSDSSGNGLTLTNNGTTTFVSGKFASGSEHVPASSQYFSTATAISGVKTVSFWVNPDSTTNYYIALTSSVEITSSSGTISATSFTSPTIYVNGVISSTLIADSWQLVTVTTNTSINADQFYLGRSANGSNYFDGTIDEVRVYNRELSPAEVSQLYKFAPGPIAYWNMDENTGTSANDQINNNTASFQSSPVWNVGKYGSAIDTANGYLQVTNHATLHVSHAITIEAWINYRTLTGNNKTIVFKNDEYNFVLVNNGKINGTALGCTGTTSNTTLSTNTWYHVVWNFNESTHNIYINGILDKTASESCAIPTTGTQPIQIGFGSPNLDGKLDEIKIYNYVRTPSQIVEDMNGGHPAPGSPVGSAAGYWKFDEGALNTCSGGTNDFCDSSPNANDLAYSTTTGGITNSGKFEKAYDGVDNTRATRTDDADFDFSSGSDSFSLSLWFNRGGTISNQEYLLDKFASNDGYTLYMDSDGDIVCGIGDGAASFPEETIGGSLSKNFDDTSWHHAVCVKDGTSSLRLYVDGNEIASDTSLAVTDDMSNSGDLIIADTNTTDGTDEWLGDIDEIRIYRLALTADQVKVEFNRGSMAVLGAGSTDSSGNPSFSAQRIYCPPGNAETNCASGDPSPVGEWKLDENTGLTAYDSSANENNGTISTTSNPPSWYPAKNGAGLSFPGTGGGGNPVSMGDPAVLDFDSTTSFTYQLWVYAYGSIGAFDKPIWKGGTAAGTPGYMMELGSGPWQAALADATTAFTANFNSTTTNTWYLLTAVVDRSDNLLKTYQNGIFQNSTSISGAGTFENSSNFLLGSRNATAAPFFGIVDDVKVYNYVRTPAQITWDYNHGGPVLWLKLDENTGTTANDSSGNAATYTLNTSSYSTGKFNYAHNGTGTSTWIAGTDDTKVDFTASQDFSISTWFKSDSSTNPSAGSNEYLCVDGLVTASPNGFAGYTLYLNDSGFLTFAIDDDTDWGASAPGTPAPDDTAASTTDLYDNNWHHVVATKIGTTSINLYIDGNLIATDASLTATGSLDNGNALKIGDNNQDNPNSFRGDIDEFRVYRYALSTAQIKLLFNNGAAYRAAPLTGTP